MASVNPSYARFLDVKLSFLEDQRDAFVNDVDQILNDGRAWIKGQNERGISYSEMNRRIDEVVNFIASRHEQIDSEVEATPDTFSSQKEVSPGPECQSQTQTETMESVRPTLPNVPEHSQGKSHDLDDIKQILNRFTVIEESVSSLCAATTKTAKAQTQMEKQLHKVAENLGTLTDRVDSLEKKSSQPTQRVGFTAFLDAVTVPEKDIVNPCCTDILTNSGSHFEPSSPEFTAPVDGLYLVSLTLRQINDGAVCLTIYQRLVNPGTYPEENKLICLASTVAANTCDTGVVVVEMSAGDLLYVEADESEGGVELGRYSCFSCILIS